MGNPKSKGEYPGLRQVIDTLQNVDKQTYDTILKNVAAQDPGLVKAIQQAMFSFGDLHLVNPKGFQVLLQKFSLSDWAIALKTASENVRAYVFSNMSERMRKDLKEEILSVGKRKLSEVTELQDKIMSAAREMKEKGELVVTRPGEEELV